jgi:hypothetical protein
MIFAFGRYELDTRVYELRRAGCPRPVEPQVFDVLAYLVQHRDRLVSKEELLPMPAVMQAAMACRRYSTGVGALSPATSTAGWPPS